MCDIRKIFPSMKKKGDLLTSSKSGKANIPKFHTLCCTSCYFPISETLNSNLRTLKQIQT